MPSFPRSLYNSVRSMLRRDASHHEELANDLVEVLDNQYNYLNNAEQIAQVLSRGDQRRINEALRHLRYARETVDKFRSNMVVENIGRGLKALGMARKINRLLDAYENLPDTAQIRNDPQAAGAAFDEFFIALGDLGSLLPPGLRSYAQFVKELGESRFFSDQRPIWNTPGQRARHNRSYDAIRQYLPD